jgi:hypothetical protein
MLKIGLKAVLRVWPFGKQPRLGKVKVEKEERVIDEVPELGPRREVAPKLAGTREESIFVRVLICVYSRAFAALFVFSGMGRKCTRINANKNRRLTGT